MAVNEHNEQHAFKAEIQQLLNILIHSLYTDREIFLRELISNASDALNRVQFEQLTNQNVLDPDAELYIEIKPDEEAGTLTISDTGHRHDARRSGQQPGDDCPQRRESLRRGAQGSNRRKAHRRRT